MQDSTARQKFLENMSFIKGSKSLKGEFGFWSKTLKDWYEDGLINSIDSFKSINKLPDGLTILGNLLGRTSDLNQEIINYDEFVSGDVINYFNFDKNFIKLPINLLPYISTETLEDDSEYTVYRNEFGAKIKTTKKDNSYIVLEQEIKNSKDFEMFKENVMIDIKKRLPANFEVYIKEFKKRDYILSLGGWPIGIFSFGREVLGLTDYLMKFYDDPKFINNILNFLCDFIIEILTYVLDKIDIDFFLYWEDMAFKNGPLISPKLFNEFIVPVYKKINGVLRDYNVKNIWVDSDGDITELIPLWLDAGITCLMPMEVQAGMDIVKVRKKYPKLQILGGIDKKSIAKGKYEIDKELLKIPFMLKSGGYIPAIDHSVPPDISWENFKYYRNNLNQLIETYSTT